MNASTLAGAWRCGLSLLLALMLPVGQGQAAQRCGEREKACIEATFKTHQVRAFATWNAEFARPLADRMGAASADLVEFVTLDNLVNGYPERPRATAVDPELMRDAKAAFNEIPQGVRNLFDHRLAGIYFLENLGSTGYTEYIDNRAGEHVAAFIILDAGVLKKFTANTWASWKENTPFKPGSEYILKAVIEEPANDNRKNAIQYILLHELGHVLSVGGRFHPPWGLPHKPEPRGRYPYLDLSWTLAPGRGGATSRYDGVFPQRKDVVYYSQAKLEGSQMIATYSNLQATNFPTLYAATRPGDDFAEAFASYVHVALMGRPWRITIERDGKVAKVIETCWNQSRCKQKRRMLEQLLLPAGKWQ